MRINTVINGDCLQEMFDIPNKSINAIISDIPYGVAYETRGTKTRAKEDREIVANDRPEEFDAFYKEMLMHFKRIIKPDGIIILFCAGGTGLIKTAELLIEVDKHFKVIQNIPWLKRPGLGGNYRSAYEMLMIFKPDNDMNYTFNGAQRKNYIDNFSGINKADIHPTEKPLPLMEDIIKLHTNKGDLILDPFAGSGTTLVAAQNLGRNFIGIELVEKHYKTCLSRLSEKKGSLL
jgi:DNA modification methylase